MPLPDDPIPRRWKAALAALYGEQFDRVVLSGSRARGEARQDSGDDVANAKRFVAHSVAVLTTP